MSKYKKRASNGDIQYQCGQSHFDESHKHFLTQLLTHFARQNLIDGNMYVISKADFEENITKFANKYFKKYKIVSK